MSLDVYLSCRSCGHSTFEANITHNLHRMDVYLSCRSCGHSTFEANITHNLNRMEACRHPEKLGLGIVRAGDLVPLLRKGLDLMRSDPDRFRAFNPKNGWGDYDIFVKCVAEYLAACESSPDMEVSVSR